MSVPPGADIYTARELASAAGVPVEQVESLMASGELPSIGRRFVRHAEAVTWGRRLRTSFGVASLVPAGTVPGATPSRAGLFEMHDATPRQPALPAAVSFAAHMFVGAVVVFVLSGIGSASAARTEITVSEPMRLVYLALPGPGGGGGGGGLKQRIPPPAAKRQGKRTLSSPVPETRPPVELEPPKVEPPPPAEVPQVSAPVVESAADPVTTPGVLEKTPAETDSQGPGDKGGVGTGQGEGIGEGEGSGIGPGSGGGTGGGPYRPGSGIEPPGILREVKPSYTDEARRRNISGEVVLEIVVRYDGSVGDVRVLDGLGYGLDQRAIEAVRQWRFSPARRLGRPVDVLVEVAIEFRLR